MTLEEYLDLVEKRKSEVAPVEIKMPSGAVWLCLPISIAQHTIEGNLPTGLFAKMRGNHAAKMTDDEAIKAGMQAMEMTRDIMLNNLVFPKIALTPTHGCITPTQIDPQDFDFFMKWVMKGGQSKAKKKTS